MTIVATAILALRLAVLAIANPVPGKISSGVAMPLTRHSSLLDIHNNVDLPPPTSPSHLKSVREIVRGFDDYQKDAGIMHPFNLRGVGSRKRGAGVPLTNTRRVRWMAEISIGTPARSLQVDIDTGSNDLFVFHAGCDSSCDDRDLWDPDTSDSAQHFSDGFEITFADGVTASGVVYQDNVTIAGFMADPQIFGVATEFYSPYNSNPFSGDGMLGLGFSSTAQNPTRNLFTTLVSQNVVLNPIFSLKLSSSGGELYIGGSNSQLYNGAITYASVIDPASELWKVSMDDIRIGDTKILEDVPVILDTGANFIFGDSSRVATLYSHIGGKLVNTFHEGFGYYYLRCDSFPTLGFTFGGRSFEIPPDVFRLRPVEDGSPYCFGSIVAEDSSVSFWSIGVPFLQLVYTVFDHSTLQVGFANLA